MKLKNPKDRNFILGVMNGILGNPGEAFLHSALVIAPFLALLDAPAVAIGLVPAIRVGGYFLPQLMVANRLAHQPYKLRYYNVMSGLRIGSLVVMTLAAFFLAGPRPGLTVVIMLITLTVNGIGSGIAGVPFADVTAKIVPHRRLGTFWALRNSVGGLLALGAGFVLSAIFASDMPFPTNFGLVFALGSLLLAAGYMSFNLVKEPPGLTSVKRPMMSMLKEVPGLLKHDTILRKFLWARFLGLAALMAEPFYAVYAIGELGAPESALGTYIMLATLGAIVGTYAVKGLSNRGQNVTVLQAGYALLLLAPLVALVAPSWQLFSLVFVSSAVGNAFVGVAAWNLLYAIAPAGDRPLYIGLSNTVLTLPSLAPVLAGALLGLVGANVLFLATTIVGAVTVAFAFRFRDLRQADQRALDAAIGGDERPPSAALAETADAVLTKD